jgi:hypothetical protein
VTDATDVTLASTVADAKAVTDATFALLADVDLTDVDFFNNITFRQERLLIQYCKYSTK